jgi:hypothetical protein
MGLACDGLWKAMIAPYQKADNEWRAWTLGTERRLQKIQIDVTRKIPHWDSKVSTRAHIW